MQPLGARVTRAGVRACKREEWVGRCAYDQIVKSDTCCATSTLKATESVNPKPVLSELTPKRAGCAQVLVHASSRVPSPGQAQPRRSRIGEPPGTTCWCRGIPHEGSAPAFAVEHAPLKRFPWMAAASVPPLDECALFCEASLHPPCACLQA